MVEREAERKMNRLIYFTVIVVMMMFASCTMVQDMNINEEIIEDYEENSSDAIVKDYDDSINTMILGNIIFADSEKIIIDEKNWVTPEDEEWKSEYPSYTGFMIVDVSDENLTYPVAKGCSLYFLDKMLRQNLEEYDYASMYKEIDAFLHLFWITIQNGEVVSIKEQYVP